MSVMSVTASLVLPADVVLLPVLELPEQLREQVDCDERDFAVTRRRPRTPSKIIDAETAALLRAFETPRTIVEAVIAFSSAHDADPEATLVEALPVLQRFMQAGWLVEAGSPVAGRVEQSYAVAEQIGAWDVRACVHVLQETELYEVVNLDGQHAAFKLLRAESDALTEHMSEREATVLAHLNGQLAPALLDSGMVDNRRFIAMEWRAGVTAQPAAAQRRARGSAGLHQLCCAVLDAYAQLHERGVLYGDVHPRQHPGGRRRHGHADRLRDGASGGCCAAPRRAAARRHQLILRSRVCAGIE